MGIEQSAAWYDAQFAASDTYRGPADVSPFRHIWAAVADRIVVLQPAAVIDLGCGPGQMAEALAARVEFIGRYQGFDFSRVAIRAARARGLPDRFTFHVRDLQMDAVPVARPAAYVACEFLEHVACDLGVLAQIPTGAPVLLTVPERDDAGHVRHFADAGQVADRYGRLLADLTVEPLQSRHFGAWGVRR
ncbi:MAG: class I SAM-dependent methyltransferase [Gemmatimonadales bacterium]|nr:class I SAM-dependent methyltransferase [Gemmatimonadales bacterium]